MPDLSAVVEGETSNPSAPELDAEAPGPHIIEIETVEAILEMYSQRPTGELEGWPAAELEGQSNQAVESERF